MKVISISRLEYNYSGAVATEFTVQVSAVELDQIAGKSHTFKIGEEIRIHDLIRRTHEIADLYAKAKQVPGNLRALADLLDQQVSFITPAEEEKVRP